MNGKTIQKLSTALMSKRLFEYVIVNAILFLTDAQIVFAASISDITDGTNRYVGAFGFPIKIYDGNTDIGTYYAVFQDLMDNTEINGVTAILNNASLAGSDNLSWTETTHKYAEVSQSMTDEQIFDSVNNIAGILEKTIQDGKPFDDLPDGVKEALKAKYDVNQSIEEYLKNNWSVSSVESGVKVALRSAYESFNSDMQTPLDKSVKIKDSNLTLNDTAAIVNRSKYSPAVDGDIAISNSKIIVNGTNDLIAHTEIIFDGSSCLQINGGAELTVQSAGNMIALKDSDLILNGSIVGNVSMEGTVSLQGSGSVSGSLNVAEGSVLNMRNSAVDSIRIGGLSDGNFSITLDVDAVNGKIDSLTAASFSAGTITLKDLNFLSEQKNFELTVLNGTNAANLVLASDLASEYNGRITTVETRNNLESAATWETAFTQTEYTLDLTRSLTVKNNNTLLFEIVKNNETAGETTSLGDTIALLNGMEDAVRMMTNSASADTYNADENFGTTAKGEFSISGVKADQSAAVINMNEYTGFVVANEAILNLQSVIFEGNIDTDGSVLTVAGGKAVLKSVKIGNPVLVSSGTLTLLEDNVLGGLLNDGTVSLEGKNTIGAMSGSGVLINNGILILNGLTNGQIINGEGETIIDADLTTTSKIDQKITINASKSLISNADKISDAVTNNGTLVLTGGTLSQAVSGTGSVDILGDVRSDVALSNASVLSGGQLTLNADKISGAVTNSGTLVLTGGTLSQAVSGTGSVDILGDVRSDVALSNASVLSGGQLTLNADKISGAVTNNGTLVLTGGTLLKELSGNVVVSGTVRLSAGSGFSGAQIDLRDGVLDIKENMLTADTINGGTIMLDLKETASAEILITAIPVGTVNLNVSVSQVSHSSVQHYLLTSSDTGYSLTLQTSGRYTISSTPFTKEQAGTIPRFDPALWTGGGLYIIASSPAEIALSELVNHNYPVTWNEQHGISELDDDVKRLLPVSYQREIDRVNDALAGALDDSDYQRMDTILREVAVESSPAVFQTAQANAAAVMSVIDARIGENPEPLRKGRSGGGEYKSGALSVWTQIRRI